MIKYLLFFLLLTTTVFAQLDQNTIKEVLILQGIQEDVDAKSVLLYNKYIEENSYQTPDLLKGIGTAVSSGFFLGVFESNVFNYTYPHLKDGALKDYLTWNSPTDKIYGKLFYPQKIAREGMTLSSRASLNYLKRYFKTMWIAYPVWWIVHNTTATVYRDWAKHGDASYSFDWNFIF